MFHDPNRLPIDETLILDSNKVLDRIKHHLQFRYDKELAEYLGITPTALSNQRALRAGLDFEAIILKCCEINLNWVFFGDEEIHHPYPRITPIAFGTLDSQGMELLAKLREAIRIIEANVTSGDSKN